MTPITVAIAGGTGNLGSFVTRAFLDKAYHPSQVARVLILSRNASSPEAQELKALGAEIVVIDQPTADNFRGADVFISCLGHGVPPELKKAYLQAALEGGVKVYFPTDYGVDRRVINVVHEVWEGKKEHEKLARGFNGGRLKVICLYNGHFLEDSIGPWFGLDTKKGVYTTVGDPNVKFTMTSKGNIGSTLVRLAVLSAADPDSVPDHVRVCGEAKSVNEIAKIIGEESGETIRVESVDTAQFKESINAETSDPAQFLRYLNGTGQVDFSDKNDNELVNPGQTFWKWKTLAEYAKEVKGRPWCD